MYSKYLESILPNSNIIKSILPMCLKSIVYSRCIIQAWKLIKLFQKTQRSILRMHLRDQDQHGSEEKKQGKIYNKSD